MCITEAINKIKTDCSDYLTICKQEQSFLVRGMKAEETSLFDIKTSKHTKTCETDDVVINKIINSYLRKNMLPLRANACFVTTKTNIATQFGTLFYIFPRNGFRFCFAKQVIDMYPRLESWMYGDESKKKCSSRVRSMLVDARSDLSILSIYCDRSTQMKQHICDNFLGQMSFCVDDLGEGLRTGAEIWFHGSYHAVPVSVLNAGLEENFNVVSYFN